MSSRSNDTKMKQAIADLSRYGKVSSLNDFYFQALNQGATDTDGNGTVENLAGDICDRFVTMFDGSLYMNEQIAGIEDLLRDISQEQKDHLKHKIMVVGAPGLNGGNDDNTSVGVIVSPITITDMLGPEFTFGSNNTPSKTLPNIALVNVRAKELVYSERGTGAVELFMNMIPTLEWSKATPYMDMKVITPGSELNADRKISGLGQLKFLNGSSIVESGTADFIMGSSNPDVPPADTETADGETPAQFSYAGMEIFTSPQTLVPASEEYRSYASVAELDEATMDSLAGSTPFPGQPGAVRAAPVIDRMRPFMSLDAVSIKVLPTRGMMSTKRAEISLTLHDRSRLSEVADLVSPSMFGKTEILMEYGWGHPDGGYDRGTGATANSTRNPFGVFIDSLRVVEKYGVFNSKYTFTDDGQVKIQLFCVTRGDTQARVSNIGMVTNTQPAYEAIENIIEAVMIARRELLEADPMMANVGGMSVIANLSPTNAAELFADADALTAIRDFIEANGEGSASDLANRLQIAAGATIRAQNTIKEFLERKCTTAGIARRGDPFLKPALLPVDDSTTVFRGRISHMKDDAQYASFARMAAIFMGHPIALSNKYDEVQMFFYAFNENAGFMHDVTVGQFPVKISEYKTALEEFVKTKITVTITDWMNWMNRHYLSNMASEAYGFKKNGASLFVRGDDGSAQISEIYSDSERRRNRVSQFTSDKDEILKEAYGSDKTRFALPRVQMFLEAVPHQRPSSSEASAPGQEGTILRMHFVDVVAAKYSSLHDLLLSKRNTEISAINTTAGTIENTEDPGAGGWNALRTSLYDKLNGGGAGTFFETIDDGYQRVAAGVPALVHKIKQTAPSITWGTQNSSLTSLQVASMHNSSDATIHMLRAQREGANSSAPQGAQDRGLPLRVMPMTMQAESLGCPILQFGQKFFVDTGTGTTVDNIYAVSELTHDIQPGSFTTSFNLIPLDSYGRYESSLSQINRAIAVLNQHNTSSEG